MRYLFRPDGELTDKGRVLAEILAGLYSLSIGLMCFLPQSAYPQYKSFSTPGIVQVGRLYILPVPFNSFVNADKLDSLADWWLVLLQNISNIFLLYPLVLSLVFLSEKWQSLRAVVIYSFWLSLFIESTQLFLDYLFDVGRVFELDDLWTNTLGGVLAYASYLLWKKLYKKSKRNTKKTRNLL